MNIKLKIANVLKQRRKYLNITEEKLANQLGYKESTIKKIENGFLDLKLSQVVEICEKLKYPIENLFKEHNFPVETIYKYSNIFFDDRENNYGFQMFDQQKLYFAKPSSFSDPFDCKIPFGYFTFSNIFQEAEYLISLDDLNTENLDQFDYNLKLYLGMSKNPTQSQSRLKEIEEMFFNDYNENSGTICFSTLFDSNSMWQFYGGDHKGICIGFKEDKIKNFDNGKIGLGGLINYVNEKLIIPIKHKNDFYYHQLMHKSKNWEFENEYRLIKIAEENQKIIREYYFDKNYVSEIYLGYKMQKEHVHKCYEKAKYYYPNARVFKMALTSNNYKLKLQPIEIFSNNDIDTRIRF